MINKNIIIGLIGSIIVAGGILLIFKDQTVSFTGASAIIADRGGLTEFQVDTNLPKNMAGFINDGTALRAFGRSSYRVAP